MGRDSGIELKLVAVRCRMAEILFLMARCGITMQERDLLIWTDGMRDSFKIDGGMRDEKQKNTSLRT